MPSFIAYVLHDQFDINSRNALIPLTILVVFLTVSEKAGKEAKYLRSWLFSAVGIWAADRSRVQYRAQYSGFLAPAQRWHRRWAPLAQRVPAGQVRPLSAQMEKLIPWLRTKRTWRKRSESYNMRWGSPILHMKSQEIQLTLQLECPLGNNVLSESYVPLLLKSDL